MAVISMMDSFLLKGLIVALPSIDCPRLIIWLARDMVIDPSLLQRFIVGIPHSKGLLIHEVGHTVSDDCHEETRRAMVEFLDGGSMRSPK